MRRRFESGQIAQVIPRLLEEVINYCRSDYNIASGASAPAAPDDNTATTKITTVKEGTNLTITIITLTKENNNNNNYTETTK